MFRWSKWIHRNQINVNRAEVDIYLVSTYHVILRSMYVYITFLTNCHTCNYIIVINILYIYSNIHICIYIYIYIYIYTRIVIREVYHGLSLQGVSFKWNRNTHPHTYAHTHAHLYYSTCTTLNDVTRWRHTMT